MNIFKSIGISFLSVMLALPTFAQTRPRPTPRPTPSPRPSPRPAPRPTPAPRPAPRPTPSPRPAPRPTPSPRPAPRPTPSPRPAPRPTPAPRPRPAPVPRPRPMPRPAPRPIPRPIPRPYPVPVPVPVPAPIPGAQACFYQGENFTGRSICLSRGQTIANLYDYGVNNTISSAIIPPGFQLTVYELAGFRGQSLVLQGEVYSLSIYGRFWDNEISAIDFRY